MAEVAIMSNFLAAFADLPKAQQKKVREFTEKFRRDPLHPSINYETLENMRDSKVRSARIDQTYRAIVVHPPHGDVYLLVWVDHHDEAYRWAKNRVFDINPHSGALQVYQSEEVDPPAPAPSGLFASYSDSDLTLIGLPAALMPAVRSVADEVGLDGLVPHLPRQAADGLQLLAAGYTLEQVVEELTRPVMEPDPEPQTDAAGPPPPRIDPDNFSAALRHPDSQQQFLVVTSDADLADILNAPLDAWRVFLHPTQRRLARQYFRGPARVLGGAGTGKTVVLLHRAAFLAREVFKAPSDRILVTTFTVNLASDLKANLAKLLAPEDLERVEVINIHRWALRYLSSHGIKLSVATLAEQRDLWKTAVAAETQGLSLAFYKGEWEQVVQAHDVLTRDDYLAASRVGRGTRLSRAQKLAVWKVFEDYRAGLRDIGKIEYSDAIREARLHLEQNPGSLPYRAILADEVQDFRPADLRLLRSLVPPGDNDVFVVGDAHQRIYGHKAALGKAGIAIRGRSRHLRINYRTTQEIRHWAVALLEGQPVDDLDGGSDTLQGYRSLRNGVVPEVRVFNDLATEARFIADWLAGTGVPVEDACVSCPTNRQVEEYRAVLGIPSVVIEAETAASGAGLRFATMHRMKGLEFRAVVLAGVQEGTMPGDPEAADDAAREDYLLGQRCLLYVAATRARDALLVTGHGNKSSFLS